MIASFTLEAMAALMHQGRRIAAVSWLLAAAANAWLLIVLLACRGPSPMAFVAMGASLAAGLAQAWYAMRVDFDARLFEALAPHAATQDAAARLDAALLELGLIGRGSAGRDWPARWRGARRQLRRQVLCLALQAATLAAGLALGKEGDVLERLIAAGFSGAIYALTGARALWRGCEPSAQRRVYFGNHASHGDFVMIWSALPKALRRNVRPVAGADYWNRDPLRRYVIRAVFDGVLIERDKERRTQDPIATLCAATDGGASLILFPEGTRNPGDGLLPFKSGIYHLACQRPELEFVPVWLDNLQRVMPKGKLLPLPLLCTATFGAPLRLQAGEEKQAFLDRARDALLALAGANP